MNIIVHKFNTRFLNFSNWSYIIEDADTATAVLIDPSWEYEVYEHVIVDRKLRVEAILVTHSHFDHTNLINKFVYDYNAKVYISKVEKEFYHFHSPNLQLIEDKETLTFQNIKVKCFLTPGHTKGSMSYLIEDNLFTGDTVFIEGCGICSGKGGLAKDMFYSIQFIKNHFKPETIIYPCHVYGRPVGQTLDFLTSYNIYFSLDNIDDFVRFRTRKGQKNLFKFI